MSKTGAKQERAELLSNAIRDVIENNQNMPFGTTTSGEFVIFVNKKESWACALHVDCIDRRCANAIHNG